MQHSGVKAFVANSRPNDGSKVLAASPETRNAGCHGGAIYSPLPQSAHYDSWFKDETICNRVQAESARGVAGPSRAVQASY